MGNFKYIPREVKEQILNRVKNEGVSVPQLASDHGISEKTIYNWLKQNSTPGANLLEMAKLRRENKILLELVGKLTLEEEKKKNGKGNGFKKN